MKESGVFLGQEAGGTQHRSGPCGKEKNVCALIGLRHVQADALWSHILKHTFLLGEGKSMFEGKLSNLKI